MIAYLAANTNKTSINFNEISLCWLHDPLSNWASKTPGKLEMGKLGYNFGQQFWQGRVGSSHGLVDKSRAVAGKPREAV